MTRLNKEKILLNIIKFGPLAFVLLFSFIITQFFITQKENDFQEEIKNIESNFLQQNKKAVQNQVMYVYNLIQHEKQNAEAKLKEKLKSRVYEAYDFSMHIYKEERSHTSHNHSKKHTFETIKNALGGVIYNSGRGYYFIDDIHGNALLQPFHKDLEGKNALTFLDEEGNAYQRMVVDVIKNKTEGFDTYYWYKGENKTQTYKKISFYKYFPPYNISIGTGEYVEDFENELKAELLKKINAIRFNERSYIFIYDLKGQSLANFNEKLVGINRWDLQLNSGQYLVQDIINFAKSNKAGYFTYQSTVKPTQELKHTQKISYLKLFEDWGWVIGTGFYTDILESKIKEKKQKLEESTQESMRQVTYISIVLTALFILISFYLSNRINKLFIEYRKELKKEMQNVVEKEKLLIQQSKMATMGEMIANIAHQWKQPLSVISISNSLLKMKEETPELVVGIEKDEAISNIEGAVENLSQTIDDFKNFFNPKKELVNFNIQQTIKKTLGLVHAQLKHNGIETKQEVQSVHVNGLENELLQTLVNLVKNSKDALLKKDFDERFIFIEAYEEQGNLIITIKDTAGGIEDSIINSIFDPYFSTKGDEGTGIGLYMSKQIIEESMKGSITAQNLSFTSENKTYKGAQFRICLPINRE